MTLMKKNATENALAPMECALCQTPKKLCRSHILPEFTFAPMYDLNHRFVEVVDLSKGRVRQGQKGYWEKLLCANCESFINRYEKHSRRMFTDVLPPLKQNSICIREHPRLDYRFFKLFCLSVLWRCSVSTLPIFRHVLLGAHEEKVRQKILQDEPGGVDEYPIQVFALHSRGEHLRDFLVEPTHMKVDGHMCYRIVMRGFVFLLFVSGHPVPQQQLNLAISPERTVTTYDADVSQFKFLREVWNRAAAITTSN